MKILLFLFPAVLAAQVSTSTINVNLQALSKTTVQAKYRIHLPKGVWAASVIAENTTGGTLVVGQGSVLKALRDKGYPALSRTDAASVILRSQARGFPGFIANNLPFAQKLLNDTEGLIVVRAIGVTPWVGTAVAGTSALLNALTPDIVAQIERFEETYDSDGIQNLLQLGPGQSAVGTVIFDAPPAESLVLPSQSFSVPVQVVTVGTPQLQLISPPVVPLTPAPVFQPVGKP